MKIFILTFFILLSFKICFSQSGTWTWMKGDSISGTEAHYGFKGLSSPLNHPSALYEASNWTDQNGNFWLYGGLHLDSSLSIMTFENVMWRFNPLTNEWTWMNGDTIPNQFPVFGIKGIPAPMNSPGGVGGGCPTFTDNAGNLWLFGGYMSPYGASNQLWKYDISLNMWTWISGDSTSNSLGNYGVQGVPSVLNSPRSRWECTSAWSENSNLWLFGGYYGNSGTLNDLWKYNILSNEWTWMKGDTSANVLPYYGAKGIENPLNNPGDRTCYSHWKDNNSFWIFGGYNFNLNACFSDMWKYSLSTNNWTWMSGSNLPNQLGYYNQYCENDPLQFPKARTENKACWIDTSGTFWMMGGRINNDSALNDLWRYYPTTNQWKFVNGDSTNNSYGNYGLSGVPSTSNNCPARMGAVSWRSNNGDLWLFGGHASRVYPPRTINDMWRFTTDSLCSGYNYPSFNFQSSNSNICPGACIDFISTSVNVNTYIWNFPGGNPDTSTLVNPGNICYSIPGYYDVIVIAGNGSIQDTLIYHNLIQVFPIPPPQAIIQNGDTLVSNQGSLYYQWYFNGNLISGATEYFYVATLSGDYNLVATDSNNCEVEAAIFNVIASIENYSFIQNEILIIPNPTNNEIEIIYPDIDKSIDVKIYNMWGSLQLQIQNYLSPHKINVSSLSQGIYFIEIKNQSSLCRERFVKQ